MFNPISPLEVNFFRVYKKNDFGVFIMYHTGHNQFRWTFWNFVAILLKIMIIGLNNKNTNQDLT